MLTHPKFVCLYVHDQDRALRFWSETVGWTVRRDVPMGPDATFAELSARGVAFATEPAVADWDPGTRWASFTDPDGTTYGISAGA